MAELFSSQMIPPRSGRDTLPAHLEARYGIQVAQLTELDLGVYRAGRRDGPDWVARVFAADRPLAAAEGDAALLRRLEQQEYPAERCAAPEPVFEHEGQGVLVTRYVAGTRADGSRETFGRLGSLLGRLHLMPGDDARRPDGHARAGGGWHHLVHQGSPAEEIAAARSRLEALTPGLPTDQRPLLAALLAELDRADGCADLPQALIHPDFVPANAILAPDGGLVLVDWTGAGRGPRLYPLAFLFWAAGCGGPSRLDAVVAGYREHVTPGDGEIRRLAGAIWARPLILACWMVLAGRRGLAETVAELAAGRELAEGFAAQAARAFRAAPATGGTPAPPPRAAVSLAGVGGTGLTIAAVRAFETARRDHLFADPLAAAFAAAGGLDPDSPPGGRRGVALRVWVVARTLFLDDLLAEAGQQGCRQVVLLGAGFDARAFRLPWPPGTRCFEVDTPDVLGPKDQVLAAEHAVPGCERLVVPGDLRDDWAAALRAAGLDPARPTAWIAEGLLVYLAPAEVDRLLDTITGLSAPGSWLGLTMTSQEASSFDGTRLQALRQSRAPDDPVGWLGGRGWAAEITGLREVLRAHGRPLPEQTPPERTQPGRAGQEDRTRPKAFLIRATLDQRHEPSGGRPGEPSGGAAAPRRPRAAPAAQTRKPGRRDREQTVLVAELGISALLSQALVAFTIEFDNESEHQLPHRTTWGPAAHSGRGPWLVSLAMWADFMRFLPAAGVPLREVTDLVPLTNLAGLERWGYVTVGPDPADGRPAPPRRDQVVRPTQWGRQAQQIWAPLTGVISQRWRERFGAAAVRQLTTALHAVAGPPDGALPPFLPVSGVQPAGPGRAQPAVSPEHRVASTDLATLLARALMSFRAEFESESAVPLPVSANVLRVLSAGGVALREVPRRAGISKEAVSVSAGWLERHGYLVSGPDRAGGRGRHVRLTPRGEQARGDYQRLADRIGDGWRARSGDGVIDGLTGALRALYAQPDGQRPPLIGAGLVPYPDGWRAHPPYQRLTEAMIADPAGALPHYPIVTHRGGYPDGS